MPHREQQEFESRLAEHRGILYKVASAYCPSGEDRDDIVQEILLQLWRSYPTYDRARRFSTWMYRVALNTAISLARSARTRATHHVSLEGSDEATRLAAEATTSEETRNDARITSLYRVLQSLPEMDRALAVLYLEEKSYREIAEVLGISETNVGTRLDRLRQTLRRELVPTGRED